MFARGFAWFFATHLALACGDSGSGEGTDTAADDDGDGTSAEPTSGPGATDPDPTSTTADDEGTAGPTTRDPTSDSDGVEVGPNFGVLGFTFYPEDASGSPAQLGMAGAWRTAELTTDDFFAVRALGTFFPPAPAAPDTLEHTGPGVYDWGLADSWVTLGNGMRLGDSVACLQVYKDKFPVYLSEAADNLDPACAPDPARWQPATSYDLTVYGGDDFPDRTFAAAVRTPTALTVSAPDVSAFNFPVDHTMDLTVTWTADGEDGDRVVIRMWDQFGEMFTANAADDGSYTIAAADLAELSLGAVTMTLTRETITDIGVDAGTLRVAARHEVWAYPDLF